MDTLYTVLVQGEWKWSALFFVTALTTIFFFLISCCTTAYFGRFKNNVSSSSSSKRNGANNNGLFIWDQDQPAESIIADAELNAGDAAFQAQALQAIHTWVVVHQHIHGEDLTGEGVDSASSSSLNATPMPPTPPPNSFFSQAALAIRAAPLAWNALRRHEYDRHVVNASFALLGALHIQLADYPMGMTSTNDDDDGDEKKNSSRSSSSSPQKKNKKQKEDGNNEQDNKAGDINGIPDINTPTAISPPSSSYSSSAVVRALLPPGALLTLSSALVRHASHAPTSALGLQCLGNHIDAMEREEERRRDMQAEEAEGEEEEEEEDRLRNDPDTVAMNSPSGGTRQGTTSTTATTTTPQSVPLSSSSTSVTARQLILEAREMEDAARSAMAVLALHAPFLTTPASSSSLSSSTPAADTTTTTTTANPSSDTSNAHPIQKLPSLYAEDERLDVGMWGVYALIQLAGADDTRRRNESNLARHNQEVQEEREDENDDDAEDDAYKADDDDEKHLNATNTSTPQRRNRNAATRRNTHSSTRGRKKPPQGSPMSPWSTASSAASSSPTICSLLVQQGVITVVLRYISCWPGDERLVPSALGLLNFCLQRELEAWVSFLENGGPALVSQTMHAQPGSHRVRQMAQLLQSSARELQNVIDTTERRGEMARGGQQYQAATPSGEDGEEEMKQNEEETPSSVAADGLRSRRNKA